MEDAQSAPPRRKMGWKKKLLIAGLGLSLISAVGCGSEIARLFYLAKECRDGSPKEAINACTRLIDSGRATAETYSLRARNYVHFNEFDAAFRDYDKSVSLDPDNVLLIRSRGAAYILKQDYGKAKSDFDHALAVDPKDYFSLGFRAATEHFLQQYDESERDYKKSIELRPGNDLLAGGLEGLAILYMEEGKPHEAERSLSEVKSAYRDAAYYQQVGWTKFYDVSPSSSVEDFTKAISLGGHASDKAALWLHIAHQRTAQDDGEEFQRNATNISNPWQASLASFMQGKIDYDGLVKRTASDNADWKTAHLCEAEFYAAESLLPKQKSQAMDLFRKIDHDCRPSDPNHIAADYELGILPKK